MTRERASERAGRLLAAGAVTVLKVSDSKVVARVRGDHAIYEVMWCGGQDWFCTCPAIHVCAHALAVRRVTAADLATR